MRGTAPATLAALVLLLLLAGSVPSTRATAVNDDSALGLALADQTGAAVVKAVDPRGVAAAGGLAPGDILVGVKGQPIANAQQALELMSQAERAGCRAVPVIVRRGAETYYLALTIPDR